MLDVQPIAGKKSLGTGRLTGGGWVLTPLLLTTLLLLSLTEPAGAQLFGTRTLGRPLQQQPGPGAQGVGEVRGNERFIRGNRGRGAFVGTDRQDAATVGFVGLEQGRRAGPVVSSTAGVRPPVSEAARINRPVPEPARNEMYAPKLEIAFPPQSLDRSRQAQRLAEELSPLSWSLAGASISVSVVERTAILQGAVASAADRDLAELLVLFEPGIEQVQNDLQVREPSLTNPRP